MSAVLNEWMNEGTSLLISCKLLYVVAGLSVCWAMFQTADACPILLCCLHSLKKIKHGAGCVWHPPSHSYCHLSSAWHLFRHPPAALHRHDVSKHRHWDDTQRVCAIHTVCKCFQSNSLLPDVPPPHYWIILILIEEQLKAVVYPAAFPKHRRDFWVSSSEAVVFPCC